VARRVLIVGATSAVAEGLAAEFAATGDTLVLAARHAEALEAVAQNLRVGHGAEVVTMAFDAADMSLVRACAQRALEVGTPDIVVFAAGDNGSPRAAYEADEIARVMCINFQSIAVFLSVLLPALERQRGAAVAIISSVAGDRGRKTNFVYGSAKAALNTYAQGLRGLLHAAGVSVTTVKLGYVDSRMSYGLTPPWLTASPGWAARTIRRAIEKRRDVVYVPGFWRLVMLAVRAIPERIFKRLALP
jgi:decaprenylphospho-beta-D-erythro-pentofuranosid-2-ulose 2-reductase